MMKSKTKIVIKKNREKQNLEPKTENLGLNNDAILHIKSGIENQLNNKIEEEVQTRMEMVKKSIKENVIPSLSKKTRDDILRITKEEKEKRQTIENQKNLEIQNLTETYENQLKTIKEKSIGIIRKNKQIQIEAEKLKKERDELLNKSLLYEYLSNPNLSENQKSKIVKSMEDKMKITHSKFTSKLNYLIESMNSNKTIIEKKVKTKTKKEVLPKKENLKANITTNYNDEIRNMFNEISGLEFMSENE